LYLSTETTLQTMIRLLDKREHFSREAWKSAEVVLQEEFKLTYLGEMFQTVADMLEAAPVPSATPATVEGKS
jgi:hypothetical protein